MGVCGSFKPKLLSPRFSDPRDCRLHRLNELFGLEVRDPLYYI